MHKAAIVKEINNQTHQVRVIFPDMDNLQSDWLQVCIPYTKAGKSNALPVINEQVLCVMDENFESGFLIASLYSEQDLTPLADPNIFIHKFEDGSYIQYDKQNHLLSADIKGSVNIKAQTDVEVSAQTIKAIAPTINATCETLNVIGGDVIVNGISFLDHVHSGVMTGSGITGVAQ